MRELDFHIRENYSSNVKKTHSLETKDGQNSKSVGDVGRPSRDASDCGYDLCLLANQ